MKLYLVLLLFGLGAAKCDTVVLNQLVDELLLSSNEIVTKAGKQTVPFPYLQFPFHKKTWWYSVTGTVTCQNGVVGELNTLKRTGDVTLTTQGDTITLKATLGIGTFDFSFPICRAKARFISVHGKTKGLITSDSLTIQVSLTYNGKDCSAKLDSIIMDHVGNVQIDLGGGYFHEFEDLLIEYIARKMNDKIKHQIEKRGMEFLGPVITKNSQKLCEKIPH